MCPFIDSFIYLDHDLSEIVKDETSVRKTQQLQDPKSRVIRICRYFLSFDFDFLLCNTFKLECEQNWFSATLLTLFSLFTGVSAGWTTAVYPFYQFCSFPSC